MVQWLRIHLPKQGIKTQCSLKKNGGKRKKKIKMPQRATMWGLSLLAGTLSRASETECLTSISGKYHSRVKQPGLDSALWFSLTPSWERFDSSYSGIRMTELARLPTLCFFLFSSMSHSKDYLPFSKYLPHKV